MHIARIPRTAATLASVAAMMCATLAACAPSGGAAQSASREGTIAVGLPGSLSTLDTAHETGIINYYVAQVVSEGLLAVGKDGQLIPAIASSYHTDDAQTWVFDIRPDALFQDGNPVTIDDVLFSIDIAKDPDKSPSSAVYWPAGVQAEQSGDNQITITLPAPAVNFGWTVTANGGLWITEKSFYEAAASYGSSTDLIMGTGPYKAVSFQPDSKAVFEKSGTWWGGDTPAQTIEFDFFSDENARFLAQKNGTIDIATQLPIDQVSQFQGINGVSVLTESDRSYVGLTFDQNVEPFDDIHVRKAVAHAVDRSTIVSSILKGQATVATGIEPPDQLGSEIGEQAAADAQAGLPIDSFDLDAARAELAQSKVPGGFDAELTYPSSIPDLGSAALAIADNLKQIGINLTVTSKPIEEWISEVGSGTYGLSYMSYTSTTGDPGEVAGWLLGPDNPARYENAQVQGLIASQATQTDPSKRVTDIVEAERIAQENTIYSPIWWGKTSTAFASRVSLTAWLTIGAFILAVAVGIPLGIAAARRRGSWVDRTIVGWSVVGVSAPGFALGLVLLYVFGLMLGWFPVFGEGTGIVDTLWHLTLPAIALATGIGAMLVRITRAAVGAELAQDYVTFARSRGVPSRRITAMYVRGAALPIITSAGLILGTLFGSTVLVEEAFSLPGLGQLLADSITYKDVPVVQAIALLVAFVIIVVTLIVDVVAFAVDPRQTVGEGRGA